MQQFRDELNDVWGRMEADAEAYSFGYQTGRRTGLVLWGKLSLSGKGLGQGFLNVAEMMVLVVFLDSIVF